MTAKLLSDRYACNVALKVRVLRIIAEAGPATGCALIEQVEAFTARAAQRIPGFDFVGWVSTTIYGLFSNFVAKQYVTINGRPPALDSEFGGMTFTSTDRVRALETAAFQEWGNDFHELIALLE